MEELCASEGGKGGEDPHPSRAVAQLPGVDGNKLQHGKCEPSSDNRAGRGLLLLTDQVGYSDKADRPQRDTAATEMNAP